MKLLFSDEQMIAVYFIKFSFMFKTVHFKIVSGFLDKRITDDV